MKHTNTVATVVKSRFDLVLDELEARKDLFVINPDSSFTRNRKISFKDMIKFTVLMGRSSISSELIKYYNFNINAPCETAYLKRREKLKVSVFKEAFNKTATLFKGKMRKYNGYRIIAVDGSGISTPHNPTETASYTMNKVTKGHNNLYITAFNDIINGIYTDAEVNDESASNESSGFITMLKRCDFAKECIFLGDRHFSGNNNFAHLIKSGAKFVFRAKDIATNGFLKKLNVPDTCFDFWVNRLVCRSKKVFDSLQCSEDVSVTFSNELNFDHFTKEKPYFFLKYRIVRFKLDNGDYEVLITNLDNFQATRNELKNLYHLRWGIEVSFRSLKHNLGLLYFHSKKIKFQMQEIYGKLILYNFCAFIANIVELDNISNRKLLYKINMVTAFKVVRNFLHKNGNHISVDELIKLNLIPIRPNRAAPRKLRDQSAKSFQYR